MVLPNKSRPWEGRFIADAVDFVVASRKPSNCFGSIQALYTPTPTGSFIVPLGW